MTLYIKGFDKDLKCRDFQFEVGGIYDTGHTTALELCTETVFHFCENIQQVHRFYKCDSDNRYCYIEVLGDIVSDENKCGSNRIKIVREIIGDELNTLLGKTNGNAGLFNTGHHNTGDCNTGDYNTGDYNTGDCNTGDYNTGNRNTGYCNTGNRNIGDCNTGYYNTGNRNTGYFNTGHYNTGNRNTGYFNTGHYNSCNYSTGLFNSEESTIKIFNIDTKLKMSEIQGRKWYQMLFSKSLTLTEWVEYTEKEKKDSIIRQCIGGYLKEYTYKEACANWWAQYSEEEKKYLIENIPNFNAKVFEEITGIKI